jgi:hypothetical protein
MTMQTPALERRGVRLGLYFFGFFGGLIYAMQMIPALLGHRIDQHIAPGVAAVSVAYGYCLWVHRGRKGWQGALAGLGLFLLIWGAGTLISGKNPAH